MVWHLDVGSSHPGAGEGPKGWAVRPLKWHAILGGFLVVWGAVSLGLAIREQQGGSQIASAISTIAGGAIIIAAAVYFGMLDTSWLPA